MMNLQRPLVALAGNPNTGKSTVFNSLTGLNQHTGNWPGKTVVTASGTFTWAGTTFTIIDLPGTYSLVAHSPDEEAARDFLLLNTPDVTVVVVDACCLERNLNLALQVLEITPKAVLCVNLMDEARRRGLSIDASRLALELGIPVVPCTARSGEGLSALKDAIGRIATGQIATSPRIVDYNPRLESRLAIIASQLTPLSPQLSPRWVALRLLERNQSLLQLLTRNQAEPLPPSGIISCSGTDEVVTWLN
ncbi:MAG: iron transporter FeoB [Firmicutes bacterium]|nr:iron transporter FeoB [Bacillota bacterium]